MMKALFWITALLLIATNAYWFYTALDSAIGHDDYKVSCEEYRTNSEILEKTVLSFKTKTELSRFLTERDIAFETIEKAEDENYILIGSLSILYLDDGKLVAE